LKPYFLPNALGKKLLAEGKRFKEGPPYGTWYLRYRDAHGVKRRLACKAASLEDAQRRNWELEEDEEAQRKGWRRRHRAPCTMRWEELEEKYLAAHAHLHSQAPMRSLFRCWYTPHFAGKLVSAITTEDCQRLVAKSWAAKQKPATVRQLVSRGRLIFKFAVRTLKVVDVNPWLEVPLPKIGKKRALYLRREHVDALLLAAGPHRLLLLMAVMAGLRRGELGGLLWMDIAWKEGRGGSIHVRRSWDKPFPKDGDERLVPLHPLLREELLRESRRATSAWVFPSPVTNGMRSTSWHASSLLKAVMRRAGIPTPPGFRFHSLRATFITHLWRGTGDVTAAQRLAGHSTPTLTESAYVGEDLEYLADAVGTLPYGSIASEHPEDIQPVTEARTPALRAAESS
jgi:integrase